MVIEDAIVEKIKNIPVENHLEYVNTLINELLRLYQNQWIVDKELQNEWNLTETLNKLYDLKLKIISCQQIEKDK